MDGEVMDDIVLKETWEDPTPDEDPRPQMLAEMALIHYNRAARISLRKEYTFVAETCTNEFFDTPGRAYWYHLNFIAQPTSESEHFTFFAEIKEDKDDVCYVMKCEIIGPTDLVSPSLNGCIACENHMHRKTIAHPVTGVACSGKY